MRNKSVKILCLLLGAVMLFGCFALFGCGNSESGGNKPDDGTVITPGGDDGNNGDGGNNQGGGDNDDNGDNGGNEPEKPAQNYDYVNVLEDPNFDNGFGVMGQRDGNQATYGFFRPEGYTTGKAYWKVAQWYSGEYHKNTPLDKYEDYPAAYDISKAERVVNGTRVSYTDASKTFAFDNVNHQMYLELNASKEYTSPRVNGGPWPHLLVQYYINEGMGVRVNQYDSIRVDFDYYIDKIENKMSPSEYNSGLHAAQLVWYLVLKNCNENSADNGKYIWFGITLYDNRNTALSTTDSYFIDMGSDDKLATGAPIYGVAGNKTHSKLPVVGEDISISVDLIDMMKSAFDQAVAKGYMSKSQWKDMYITDGNIGWELPGTFDCAFTINKFEINAGKLIEEA